ncbi:MAG: hypothetical protein V3T17_11520 [Pseudomonadales bacterium]
MYWVVQYLEQVRPELLINANEHTLFLNDYGEPFRGTKLGDRVKRLMKKWALVFLDPVICYATLW